MNRREFLKTSLAASAISCGNIVKGNDFARAGDGSNIIISNPYKNVDWKTFKHYKAAMHLHTLQSDGRNSLSEVVHAYRKAGYTIMAITDHDLHAPNYHIRRGRMPGENASPYPAADVPMDITWPWTETAYTKKVKIRIPNYPANTTWPWTEYGCLPPRKLEMVGIEGNELSYRHHINSYFNDYSVWYDGVGPEYDFRVGGKNVPYGGIVDSDGREIWEDDQLRCVAARGGLAILNHPGIEDKYYWWMRQPLEWYAERFRRHSPDCLIGMEITNCTQAAEPYDEGLWDQMLARFMPDRPVWGFGNDDMHNLRKANNMFNVMPLSECTEAAVRRAMESGQFYFCKSTNYANYLDDPARGDIFPTIENIEIDPKAGTIAVSAVNYDEVRWISSPASLSPIDDYRTSDHPWPLGQIVHDGAVLNCRSAPNIKKYVRAEFLRRDGGHVYRTFTNPFGIRNV